MAVPKITLGELEKTMTEPTGDKPKLIIDEDWKTQVERERAEMRLVKEQAAAESDPTAASSTGSAATGGEASHVEQPSAVKRSRGSAGEEAEQLPPPPPASFPFLVSMLGTQALVAMGQLGDQHEAPPPRLDYAKHYIDLLGLLEEKTKGNLAAEEASLLADWLHQLRLGYVEVAKRG